MVHQITGLREISPLCMIHPQGQRKSVMMKIWPRLHTHTHTGFHGDVTAGSPMGHSVDIKGVYISSGVFVCRDNVLYVADVYSVDINIKH